MAHSFQSSSPSSSENWIDPANATNLETTGLLTPNADEERGAVEEWTPKSLGASFIWIETGIPNSPNSLTLN
jgi:hypothetical protein